VFDDIGHEEDKVGLRSYTFQIKEIVCSTASAEKRD